MSLRSWFGRSLKPNPPHEQKLGIRSPFVLAKIGHDMREDYNGIVEQPLPEEIQQAVSRLPSEPVLRSVEDPQRDSE